MDVWVELLDKRRNFAAKILNQFMFAYIILYVGQTQSLGERVFIGALSGLVFSIFIWLMNKRSAKKEQKEAELVKANKAS